LELRQRPFGARPVELAAIRHFISIILERLRAMLHPREQQQQQTEEKRDEHVDDPRVGLFLDGDLVTGIERKPTDPKSDR
jgi:hypothetical protein